MTALAHERPPDDGLGLTAAGVRVVFEVLSSGHRNPDRDQVRKRREHARTAIPEGPAKGFVVTETITGPARAKE